MMNGGSSTVKKTFEQKVTRFVKEVTTLYQDLRILKEKKIKEDVELKFHCKLPVSAGFVTATQEAAALQVFQKEGTATMKTSVFLERKYYQDQATPQLLQNLYRLC
jgi:hypothetical protein